MAVWIESVSAAFPTTCAELTAVSNAKSVILRLTLVTGVSDLSRHQLTN